MCTTSAAVSQKIYHFFPISLPSHFLFSTPTMLANVSSTLLSGLMTVNQNNPALLSQQIILGLNTVGLGISLVQPHNHYHVDLLGTGAFAASTLPSLLSCAKLPARITWTSAAVAAWSLKLAAYLFYRVTQRRHDARLDAIMENPLHCAGFWTYSALWGILCSLPYSMGLSATTQVGNPWLLKAGMGLFGLGFVVETAADYQKWQFKQTHPNENCQTGLWALSQHPNYFGNLVLWLGILVANSSVLYVPPPVSDPKLWQRVWAWRRWALALVGPAFMWRLFDTQARGILLSDSFEAQRKKYGYGTNLDYTKYVDGT
jgi:steroid 5-alpha reductase family enzyme